MAKFNFTANFADSREHPFSYLPTPADLVLAQRGLDAEQAVVLRHPLGAAGGSRLDEGRARGHGDVGDGGVLGLP